MIYNGAYHAHFLLLRLDLLLVTGVPKRFFAYHHLGMLFFCLFLDWKWEDQAFALHVRQPRAEGGRRHEEQKQFPLHRKLQVARARQNVNKPTTCHLKCKQTTTWVCREQCYQIYLIFLLTELCKKLLTLIPLPPRLHASAHSRIKACCQHIVFVSVAIWYLYPLKRAARQVASYNTTHDRNISIFLWMPSCLMLRFAVIGPFEPEMQRWHSVATCLAAP